MHTLRAVSPVTGSVVYWNFGAGPIRQQPELCVSEGAELVMRGIHTGPVVAGVLGRDGLIVEVELAERPSPSSSSGELVTHPAREG